MSLLHKFFKILFPVLDFLYILQLEEYNHGRYVQQIQKRFLLRNFQKRDTLKFTLRVKLILMSILLVLLISVVLPFPLNIVWPFLALTLLAPITVLVASLCVTPPVTYIRHRQITSTKEFFSKTYPNTQVIAITGSYGKTTTKYLLQAILEYTYKTAIIPDNINTTLGISDYILAKQVPLDAEYLIVEMGAYQKKDIAEAATMLPPDISILTCLGDQHLERFGSYENLVTGKNEIFTHAKADALRFADVQTISILKQHAKRTDHLTPVAHSETTANKPLAVAVAQELNVKDSLIDDALQHFNAPSRRNVTYEVTGVTVIDNSYNISPTTAEYVITEAAKVARRSSKKLVVLTAGIAEQGELSASINTDLAVLLNTHADRVIVLPSMYTPAILQHLKIPYTQEEFALTILENVSEHVHASSEVLLQLPEHTDLVYFD